MRLLSGFSRYLCAGALLAMLSCASAPPDETVSLSRVLDGEVMITGGGPGDRSIRLTTENGASWLLVSPSLEGELLKLGGHQLRVWGDIAREADAPAALHVERYEMLPVDGMSPVIGIISVNGPRVVFSVQEGRSRYELTGPLREAMSNFHGCKAWVWGMTTVAPDAAGDTPLEVMGYGILGPAHAASVSAPSDTLRN